VVILICMGRRSHVNVNYEKGLEWLDTRPCATGGYEWGTGVARDNMGTMSLHVA
jgi:hypothetical protein